MRPRHSRCAGVGITVCVCAITLKRLLRIWFQCFDTLLFICINGTHKNIIWRNAIRREKNPTSFYECRMVLLMQLKVNNSVFGSRKIEDSNENKWSEDELRTERVCYAD